MLAIIIIVKYVILVTIQLFFKRFAGKEKENIFFPIKIGRPKHIIKTRDKQ